MLLIKKDGLISNSSFLINSFKSKFRYFKLININNGVVFIMARLEKHLRLNTEVVKYVEEFMNKEGIEKFNEGIESIVREHKFYSKIDLNSVQDLIKNIVENYLKKIQNSINSADKNSQIIIELINGFMIKQNIKDLLFTDEETSPVINKATETVNKRIEAQRIKRLERS
ncbi:hypothetical protein H9660_14160 [Clostridium sp. Sa3CUN1]|uniref:Uncharacterized protein n=1 Tax=Clostridium gallinarum TaxID=2762246 RepID=A0ABR8Q784_9CLOT|nr:hypothetical protein [Clostridium gallinarum]MBD7916287.1 hypothetical protein [Clostridium gallinarum]